MSDVVPDVWYKEPAFRVYFDCFILFRIAEQAQWRPHKSTTSINNRGKTISIPERHCEVVALDNRSNLGFAYGVYLDSFILFQIVEQAQWGSQIVTYHSKISTELSMSSTELLMISTELLMISTELPIISAELPTNSAVLLVICQLS